MVQLLKTIGDAEAALGSDKVLWTYRDEALALVEEPFSDCFAVVYGLEAGLCCYIEYDSGKTGCVPWDGGCSPEGGAHFEMGIVRAG